MNEEIYEEKACDCIPGERKEEYDLTTEEGKKEYLEWLKADYKKRYQNKVERNLKEEVEDKIREQARLEAIKELGITEKEYDKVFGYEYPFKEREPEYAQLDDEQCEAVAERIRLIQERQNKIITIMICKATHVDADKKGIRNAYVSEYLDLEKSKATQLDILSSAYLKSDGAMNVVNDRGNSFAASTYHKVVTEV